MPVALITGASRGIGRAIAQALAPTHSLLLVGRDKRSLEEVARTCVDRGAAAALPITTDLADPAAPGQIAGVVARTHAQLDVLVNNAGTAINKKFGDYTLQDWDSMMGVNARAPFFLTQALLPLLRNPEVAWIINVGSAVSKRGYESQSIYTASKHALLGMTKAIARDLAGSRIRVHALLPGGVNTDMIREMRPDIDESQLIAPDEVGEVVLNLLAMKGNAMIDEIEIRRRQKQAWP